MPESDVQDTRAQLTVLLRDFKARLPSVGPLGAGALGPEVGVAFGRQRAAHFDDLLAALFPAACASSGLRADQVALGAVGSFGRGAVALGADLDVRLVGHRAERGDELARTLLYPLWDAGFSVGHQVVTVEEVISAARSDLPTATSLLDYRHIAGDRDLSRELDARARASLFAPGELGAFVARLRAEVGKRHHRFGGSLYMLEPDVKHGPGALRDLDVAGWAANARWGVHDLSGLARVGVVSSRELMRVLEARELLWRIRNMLHHFAGRRSDRLGFEEQEHVAACLGFEGDAAEAVERLMSDYYRAADAIARFRDTMLDRSVPALARRRPAVRDLGRGIVLFDGEAALARTELLQEDPCVALALVREAVSHGVPVHPHARGAVVAAASSDEWSETLRLQPAAASLFVELVVCGAETALRAGSTLREVHELGLLVAMIPEFAPLVGRVHHDTYHVYTVDVHSVAAVDRLLELARGELVEEDDASAPNPDERPAWGSALAHEIASEIARPHVLFLATLLHDVGKAIGRRDHSERGAEMVPPILARLGIRSEDAEDVAWLVQNHLRMYHVATRRDLDDAATIGDFVRDVGSRDALRELYLLTVADLSTTSPTSMTSWKAHMLDELFLAADQALANRAAGRGSAPVGSARERMVQRLERARFEAATASASMRPETERPARLAFLDVYLGSMPERYLIRQSPEAVAAHAELARQSVGQPFGLARVPSRHEGAAEICVAAPDRPGILAAITAAFAGSRLEVHAAEIHSRHTASSTDHAAGDDPTVQALDLFWVRHAVDGVAGVERALAKVRHDLGLVLAGSTTPAAVARISRPGLRKPPRDVVTRVLVDNRASPDHTVVEVVTRDRPGLLFTLAEALHAAGLTIAVAKIGTEGTRVIDVFYVTTAGGQKVTGDAEHALRRKLHEDVEAMDA